MKENFAANPNEKVNWRSPYEYGRIDEKEIA